MERRICFITKPGSNVSQTLATFFSVSQAELGATIELGELNGEAILHHIIRGTMVVLWLDTIYNQRADRKAAAYDAAARIRILNCLTDEPVVLLRESDGPEIPHVVLQQIQARDRNTIIEFPATDLVDAAAIIAKTFGTVLD